MKRVSTGSRIVIGIALFALLVFAVLLLVPVVNKDPGFPRQPRAMASIIVAMQAYHNDFGSFPQGTSDDILSALQGANARKIFYLDLSDDLTRDDWQTPYRIQIDDRAITVSSAGSDRKWDTDDDVKKEKIIEQGS